MKDQRQNYAPDVNNSQTLKQNFANLTTIDNNNSKNFINLNQNEFLTNNNSVIKTQENNENDRSQRRESVSSGIYVNHTYSREYINELKVD